MIRWNGTVRFGNGADVPFINDMIFEANFWNPSMKRPDKEEFLHSPERQQFRELIARWDALPGATVAIAEEHREPIGAAWYVFFDDDFHGDGYLGPNAPELGIGIHEEHRGKGVGRALMQALTDKAKADGVPRIGLSTVPANPARHLYTAVGFRELAIINGDITMGLELAPTWTGALRSGNADDLPFLREMLFEAFFWRRGIERPDQETFLAEPEPSKLLADWGSRDGDTAIIGQDDSGTHAGAAWYRYWTPENHSYGFVDSHTPEVAIAVADSHRAQGVGRAVLTALIAQARTAGVERLSLSVEPDNHARNLYQSLGFHKIDVDAGGSWTMALQLR